MEDRFPFGGRVVVVTGGARGIGRAIAHAFLESGASVVVCGRNANAETVRAGGAEASYVAADVREPEAAERVIGAAVERYGRLTRIPAVSLGWFDAPADAPPKEVVIRQISGLNLSTTLSLIRSHGEQRPSAALVWEMAKMPPTKRKPEHRRRSQADAGSREKNAADRGAPRAPRARREAG